MQRFTALWLLVAPFTVSGIAAGKVVAKAVAKGPFGKYNFYHSSDDIESELSSLSCEGFSYEAAHDDDGDGDVSLPVVRLKKLAPAKGQQAAGDDSGSSVMMVFGEHPRELVSPEVGLNLVKSLCSDAGREAREANSYTFVLNANPVGRRKIETDEDWCVRTNEHNVDLNRNYGQGWEEEKEGGGEDGIGIHAGRHFETWSSGSSAFSEPESRIVRGLIRDSKPHVFVDVHSGTQAVIMPWAYTKDPIDDKIQQQRLMRVGKELKGYCEACSVGPGVATVGYKATGTASDYAFGQGVPYSFTTEIYTNGDQAHADHLDGTIYAARKEVAKHDNTKLDDDIDSAETAEDLLKSADIEAQASEKKDLVLGQGLRGSARKNSDPTNAFSDVGDLQGDLREQNNDRTFKCFGKFNPSSKAEYDEVVGRWTRALMRLPSAVKEADNAVILPDAADN